MLFSIDWYVVTTILWQPVGPIFKGLFGLRRPLKMGWIGCPKTSAANYQWVLHNISDNWRSLTLWQKLEITVLHVSSWLFISLFVINLCDLINTVLIFFTLCIVCCLWLVVVFYVVLSLKFSVHVKFFSPTKYKLVCFIAVCTKLRHEFKKNFWGCCQCESGTD
jgi:hypothetical protein